MAPRRGSDPKDVDWGPRRRYIGNGRDSLSRWVMALVLAVIPLGWGGFIWLAKTDMEATKAEMRLLKESTERQRNEIIEMKVDLKYIKEGIETLKEDSRYNRRR